MQETALTVHPSLLDPSTGQPMQAIGHRRNGDPIWPVIGAAPEDEEETETGETGTEGEEEDEPLGPKGQKALDAEKERRRAAAARAREAEAARDAALAELARVKAGTPAEGDAEAQQRARQAEIDAAVKAVQDEATRNANRRVLRADVIAQATGKLANPEDAVVFGDLDSIELQADGTAAPADIADLIAAVLTKRPYLAAQGGARTPPASEVDAGPQGASDRKGRPRQVTEAELKTMTPEQIVKARQEGRLADLLGG